MTIFQNIREVTITVLKFLVFKPVKPDLTNLGNYYLMFGILTAWLAGVGRYWDNPKAYLWQHLGLGSVAYVFIMALILWVIIKPLRPKNWSYKSVLIFVGMTSLPAILYAIPVERYFSIDTAKTMNVWFLAIVATWRVILLFNYLRSSAQLSFKRAFIATLLPIVLIISLLTFLNLEHAVFEVMGGFRQSTSNDSAYAILVLITSISILLSPILLIAYIISIPKINKTQNGKNN